MADTHELRLKIDASAAKRGSRDFTSAIEAVRKAVRDLDRDTTGAFTQLRNISPKVDVTPLTRARTEANALASATDTVATSTDRAADNIRKMAIQSANALRVSSDQASRLRDRLLSVGDTAGLSRLEAGLDNLRSSLISATSGLDIREARAGYADLASELNRTARESERLRAEAISLARAEQDAAAAAQSHGAALERLRAAHDPLFASSKRYETALREIQTLEDAGAMSAASAAQARDRAAQSMLAAGGAADAYAAKARVSGHETAYLASQFNDIGVMLAAGQSPLMLALQQGTQVSQMLNQMGGRTAILRGLASGFISMVNPISLATIGIIAGGAALGQWAMAAMLSENAAESFKRQLAALATASGDMQQTLDVLNMSALDLAEKYGTAAQRVRELAIAQAELRMGEIRDQLRDQLAALDGVTRGFSTAATGGHTLRNTLNRLQDQFGLTRAEAQAFNDRVQALGNATTFDEQRDALQEIVRFAKEAGISLSDLPPSLREAAIGMIDLSNESDAMAQLLQQAQDAISGNTSATDNWASAMSGVRAEINAIGSALANIGGGVIDNAAKSAELTALQAGKTVQQAAVARERYKREAEWSAREAAAGDGIGGWIQRQLIGAERYQFEQGVSLDEQIAATREAARKAARTTSSSGSSRTKSLNDEADALDRLRKSVEDRVINLHNENAALELVASGQMENIDTARLMVDAMVANGGAIDSTTASLIAQYDAAEKLNEALKEAARDPLKEWQDAVPSYLKIGNDIEAALISSVQSGLEGLMTGDFDLESWGDQILSSIASTVAPNATEELFALSGLDQLIGGVGDWTAGLGGDGAQLTQGGQVAGHTIATAMTTAGSTVAQQIAQAMGTGGSQAAVQQQTAIMQGGAQAASQSRTAGVQNASQLRSASAQGGQQLARGVVSGSQQGAPILASGIAQVAAGGGGGIFSTALNAMGFGDVGSAITTGLSLFGFSEGGYSDRPGVTLHTVAPSAFQNAPHYAQGTANTSGIPAVLHPNEAVIPLSKGRKVPVEMGGEVVGSRVFNQTINQTITTPDADSFRKSKKQIANEMHRAGASANRSLS